MTDDLARINRLLDACETQWATALLRAMRRNILDGRELTPMNRSALDRIERLFLTTGKVDETTAFSAATGPGGPVKIKTRTRKRRRQRT